MIPLTKENLPKKLGEIVEENIAKLLDEGYFKSYPVEPTKRAIEKALQKSSIDYKLVAADEIDDKDEYNDLQILYLQIESFSDETKDALEPTLKQCGWYIADAEYHSEFDSYLIHIEPKFPIENSKVKKISEQWINKFKLFYHVTFKKNRNNILKSGLSPSLSKRREFNHPERVYLFGDKSIAEDFVKLHETSKLQYAKDFSRRKDRKTGEDAKEKYQDSELSKMICFQVDLDKMMKDGKTVSLYHDNRWDTTNPVFFTQNTINPKYLKEIIP